MGRSTNADSTRGREMIGWAAEVLSVIERKGWVNRQRLIPELPTRHPEAIDNALGLLLRGGAIEVYMRGFRRRVEPPIASGEDLKPDPKLSETRKAAAKSRWSSKAPSREDIMTIRYSRPSTTVANLAYRLNLPAHVVRRIRRGESYKDVI